MDDFRMDKAIGGGTFEGKKIPDAKRLARLSDKFIYHSGTVDDLENMKWGLEPQHGQWIKELAQHAGDIDPEELLDRSTPLVWMSDDPSWVAMKVGRKLGKHPSDVEEDDIRRHGHVAMIPKKGDHADHVWKVGDEGLFDGEYSLVTNLKGETKKAYETDLYQSDWDGNKTPFGVERNEYISAQPVEPMFHLTGDDLVDFLKETNQISKADGGSVDDEGITAYHGSPHDFEQFDIGKIGTGEGAQAYGRGLYFAEAEPVAKDYREKLSSSYLSSDKGNIERRKLFEDLSSKIQESGNLTLSQSDAIAMNLIKGIEESGSLENFVRTHEINAGPKGMFRKGYEIGYDFLKNVNPKPHKGHMYEVGIDAHPDHFLDWDKPLRDQPEIIRRLAGWSPEHEQEHFSLEKEDTDALLAALEGDGNYSPVKMPRRPAGALSMSTTGSDVYEHFKNKMGAIDWPVDTDSAQRREYRDLAAKKATDYLLSHGIKGIKYLDRSSRAAGEGSRNYVVFDDKLVNVKRKYEQGGEVEGYARGGVLTREDTELQRRMKKLLRQDDVDPERAAEFARVKGTYEVPVHERGAYSKRVLPMEAQDVTTTIGSLGNAVPKTATKMGWNDFHKIGKGGTIFTLGGDRSNLGRLTHINGKPLDWAVDLHAGTKYMLEPNEGAVWANDRGAATALRNNILAAAEKGPVYGAFAPMAPTAVDSSVNMFDALMAQVPKSGISKKDAKKFDDSLKAGEHIKGTDDAAEKSRKNRVEELEDWPGILNAKKASDFARNLSGAHRAAIVKHMEAAPWQKMGFPSVGITRAAITDPELLSASGNMMGHHIVELDPTKYDTDQLAFEHSTYPVPTSGKLVGKVPLIERQVAMPDYAEGSVMDPAVHKKGNLKGEPLIIHPYSPNPLGRASWRGNTELRQAIQPINDRMLESIQEVHGTDFADGGEVPPAAKKPIANALRVAQHVADPVERAANLSRFMKGSKTPLVLYHSTHADIPEFKRTKGSHFGFHFGDIEAANTRLEDTADKFPWPKSDIDQRRTIVEKKFNDMRAYEEALRRKNAEVPMDELTRALEAEEDLDPIFKKYEYVPTLEEKAQLAALREAYQAAQTPIIQPGGVGANIGAYHVAIKNPLRMTDVGDWGSVKAIKEHLPFETKARSQKELVAELKKRGYDGIVYQNRVENPVMKTDSFIAFDPEQIKSATGNRGTFDIDSPRLNENRGGEVPSAANNVSLGKEKGLIYEKRQEGPFYRVRKSSSYSGGSPGAFEEVRGGAWAILSNEPGGERGSIRPGSGDVKGDAPEENFIRKIANSYTKDRHGKDLEDLQIPKSSLQKQAAIGRAFMLGAEKDPNYKKAVFDAYAKQMPDVVEQSGARNYDELLRASYQQMAKETSDQFDSLPIHFSFYKNDEGLYPNSNAMIEDVNKNKHLFVYQGGDKHDFLHNVDPETGLNENEKFRAVHDAFGHAVLGNTFGPQGEERAWMIHQQMYSPLAKLAMSAETRGQNSVVNYTPLNASLLEDIYKVNDAIASLKRMGKKNTELEDKKKGLFASWQYAPQAAVLLPPEFLDPYYEGGMPDYIQTLIKPSEGTYYKTPVTHFSHDPSLKKLDPTRYGTGIPGDEASRLKDAPDIRDRSYMYLGDVDQVKPEPGLGEYAYSGEADKLYNMVEDPANLVKLATETNRRSPLSNFNPGMVDPAQKANDIERLAKMYGYSGVANPKAAFPMAALFQPPDVVRTREHGGQVDPVKRRQLPVSQSPIVDRALMVFSGSAPRLPGAGPLLRQLRGRPVS